MVVSALTDFALRATMDHLLPGVPTADVNGIISYSKNIVLLLGSSVGSHGRNGHEISRENGQVRAWEAINILAFCAGGHQEENEKRNGTAWEQGRAEQIGHRRP